MDKGYPANPSSISNLESRIFNHSVYTGSFAALEARWMEVIAELQRDDPLLEIHVLIGSNILASYLKRRLAENGRAVANIRFHTFLDLAGRLAVASGNAVEKPRLPSLGAAIILKNTLAENSPSVYAPLSEFRGFRDALLETFRDLRDAGFDPKRLDDAVQGGSVTQDRRPHLLGLADLYRGFRKRVSLFHDVDDDFKAAIRLASEPSRSLGFSRLLVYGIYDATGQQSRLLSALRNSVELIYFVPFVDTMVSDFARPFLEARAGELGVTPVPLQTQSPSSGLSRLAGGQFGFSQQSGAGARLHADGSFALVSVPGESRAAVEIVREIFRAVQNGTVSGFHEAAVIMRQPESDIPILTEVLRLHDVPFFVHSGSSFADRPLSKAIAALSNLESNGFSREAILTAMELVAASLPETSLGSWDVQSWRALTNDPRFLAGAKSWDSGTEALVEQAQRELIMAQARPSGDAEEESVSRVYSLQTARARVESAKSLRDAWQLLRQAAADWPARLSWRGWGRYLERHFEQIVGTSNDWPFFSTVLDELGNLPDFETRDSKSMVQNSTKDMQPEEIPIVELKSALMESIASLSYPVGRFQRSGVNLLSTSAARGLRFPLVIIPGLDEGRFPAKLRQDPLLLDSERLWLGGLPIKSKRIDEEKLLFDMAARSAEKRLVLMTSRLDESSDREKIPSQFFLRVAAAVRGGVVQMRDLAQDVVPGFRSVSLDNTAPAKGEVPVDEGEIRLRLVTAEHESARMALEALAALEPSRLRRPLAYDRARWNNRLTGFDGLVSDPLLLQWTAQKNGISAGPVSASRLEEYAKCPYFFFLKRIMDLESWEEQRRAEGMDPLDRGLVVHAVLEQFLKDTCGELNPAASHERLWQLLEPQARDALEKSRPAGTPDLLWEIERDSLLAMLHNWLVFEIGRLDGDMHARRLEQAFGEFSPEEKYPALRLKAGAYAFDFRGRIDRIDVSRDGKRARVIDYKTGALPESMARKTRTPLMSGEKIQIVIYRAALRVFEEFRHVNHIDGEYLHLQPKDGRVVSCSFTDEELEQASRALPAIMKMVGDGIERGVFFARTSGAVRPTGHCDFCDYLPICGKDREQREERKSSDPAVRGFLKILEPQ